MKNVKKVGTTDKRYTAIFDNAYDTKDYIYEIGRTEGFEVTGYGYSIDVGFYVNVNIIK